MKQTVTKLSMIILAALIFYGGAGVNFVSFCCDACQSAGIQVVKDGNCCEVHGHSHEAAVIETASGMISHTHEMCCDLERLDFDWNSSPAIALDLQPIALDLLSFGTTDLLMPVPLANEETTLMPTGPPPVFCPRVYLSLLTTLLI